MNFVTKPRTTHPIDSCIFPRVPHKLDDGAYNSQCQPNKQDHKDATHVGHTQGVGLAVLFLLLIVACACILPPLVVQHLNAPILLHAQDRHGDGIPVWRICNRKDSCMVFDLMR